MLLLSSLAACYNNCAENDRMTECSGALARVATFGHFGTLCIQAMQADHRGQQ